MENRECEWCNKPATHRLTVTNLQTAYTTTSDVCGEHIEAESTEHAAKHGY